MENKYYTPVIEEFYVGFEFELEETEQGTNHTDWHESIFGNLLINSIGGMYSTDMKIVKGWIEKDSVRVKFLDQEDIESLRWENYDGDLKIYNLQINFDLYSLFIHGDTRMLRITKEQNTLFKGEIKNKSELKKLMIQLGIL